MKSLSKSFFILLFPLFALLVLVYSISMIVQKGIAPNTLSITIVSLTIILFFGLLFIFRRARTDRYILGYTIPISIGMLIGIYAGFKDGFGSNQMILVSLLFLGWMIYLFWYSRFDDRSGKSELRVGEKLPSFVLENHKAEKINTQSFIGGPSIFLFYRGNWCPLCMAQIKEVAAQYKALEKLGANMVLISPQPHSYTKKLAKRFDVGFHYLVDVNSKMAKQLGIFAKFGTPMGFQVFGYESDTVLPTVIITDENGKVIFLDQTDNYRVRPEPETFLNVLTERK